MFLAFHVSAPAPSVSRCTGLAPGSALRVGCHLVVERSDLQQPLLRSEIGHAVCNDTGLCRTAAPVLRVFQKDDAMRHGQRLIAAPRLAPIRLGSQGGCCFAEVPRLAGVQRARRFGC